MAFKVPAHKLPKLIEKLTLCLPLANRVRSTAKRARSGRVSADFYTDGWPDFTTVGCHILSPALSDEGDVIAYSTCKETLLHVIQESGAVTWSTNGWQLLEGFEAPFADYLLDNLQLPPGKDNLKPQFMYDAVRYILLGEFSHLRALPDDFFVEELKPEHATFLTQHWYPEVLARPIKAHRYFSTTIEKCHSVGVFRTSNPTNPISWQVQHNHGQLGHAYTLKEFRGMGLLGHCMRSLSQRILDDGDLIETMIDENNHSAIHLAKKLGLSETCKQKSFSIGLA